MRPVILVLGMHRSGTSAVAGAVRMLGVDLGDSLMPGRAGENPQGFFEDTRVMAANENILESAASSWDDPFGIDPGWFDSDEGKPHARDLSSLLVGMFPEDALCGVKDPRICRLLPVWTAALEQAGLAPHVLLVTRPCAEVADSLARRNGFSREKSAFLWADHVLRAEEGTRRIPRVFLPYADLLENPAGVLAGAGHALGITWPVSPEAASTRLRAFVTGELRHHRVGDAEKSHRRADGFVRELDLLLESVAGGCGGGTTRFDRMAEQVAAVLPRMDPLWQEHLSRGVRVADQVAGLEQTLSDRTEWLRASAEEVKSLRAAVEEMRNAGSKDATRLRVEVEEIRAATLDVGRRVDRLDFFRLGMRLVRFSRRVAGRLVRGAARRRSALHGRLRDAFLKRPVTRARVTGIALPQHEHPDVSIIIPVFNQTGHTVRCLESLAALREETSFEVVLVDDASTAASIGLLASVRSIRLVRNERNLGFVHSCNRGAKEAKGRHLLFLNNDTRVEPGFLDRLRASLEEFPDAGIVGAQLVYPDGRLQESGGIVWEDASAWNYGHGRDPSAPEVSYLREVDYCSGACILVDRSLFNELGGFDERYAPAYYEDVDLAFRVREAGRRVLVNPVARVIHCEGATSGTDPESGVKRYQVRNQQIFLDRWRKELGCHGRNGEDPERAKERKARSRALVIDHRMPTPDQDAGSQRIQWMMRILRDLGHRVTFLPDNLLPSEPYGADLRALGVEVWQSPHLRTIRHFLECRGSEFDLVILSRLGTAGTHIDDVRRLCPRARVVFDTVDLHFLREERAAELTGSAADLAAARETRTRELSVARRADETLVVSEEERELIQSIDPNLAVRIVPTIHETSASGLPFEERHGLLFVGGFEHPPNADGVRWFVETVLPMVREELPDVSLRIVGSKPTPEMDALAGRGVDVAGWVPDLEALLRESRVSIAPLRFGAGVKGKVCESLAHGLPTVGTSIACEGMALTHRTDICIADTAHDFAREVVRLHQDRALWTQLASAGQEVIRNRFSPAVARDALRRLGRGPAESPRGGLLAVEAQLLS